MANQELPEGVMLPSKFVELTKKDVKCHSDRRNGTARVFIFSCLVWVLVADSTVHARFHTRPQS